MRLLLAIIIVLVLLFILFIASVPWWLLVIIGIIGVVLVVRSKNVKGGARKVIDFSKISNQDQLGNLFASLYNKLINPQSKQMFNELKGNWDNYQIRRVLDRIIQLENNSDVKKDINNIYKLIEV